MFDAVCVDAMPSLLKPWAVCRVRAGRGLRLGTDWAKASFPVEDNSMESLAWDFALLIIKLKLNQ